MTTTAETMKPLTMETARQVVEIYGNALEAVTVCRNHGEFAPPHPAALKWCVFFMHRGNPLSSAWGYVETKEAAEAIAKGCRT